MVSLSSVAWLQMVKWLIQAIVGVLADVQVLLAPQYERVKPSFYNHVTDLSASEENYSRAVLHEASLHLILAVEHTVVALIMAGVRGWVN